ncbi:ryncolin-4-like isoform 2-T2 [Cochliomyia hominivorax]
MYLNILFIILIVINFLIINHHCEPLNTTTITYVDEIEILKKIFINLNELKNVLERCNLRLDEFEKNEESDSSIFDVRYDHIPKKCLTTRIPKSCNEATSCIKRSGIYNIVFERYSSVPIQVECDVKTQGGGWLIIQRRQDGSVDFYRNWDDYKLGFGQIDGEFFIGLEKLHALTNYDGPQELLILLEDDNEIKYAKYNNFVIGNESEQYALKHLGVYSGNAGDSLALHLGMKFSTKDRDNDESEDSCSILYTGAWWYKKCHVRVLHGIHSEAIMSL